MRSLAHNIIALLVLFMLYSHAYGQGYVNQKIELKNQTINANNNIDEWKTLLKSNSIKLPIQVLVKGTSPIDFDDNVELVSYLPDNTYCVIVKNKSSLDKLKDAGVYFVTNVESNWKIHEDVLNSNSLSDDLVFLNIAVAKSTAPDQIELKLSQFGGIIKHDRHATLGYYTVQVPSKNILLLASWYKVLYISYAKEDIPLNLTSKSLNEIALANTSVTDGGYGLNGEGITIGVGDNTSGIFHIDLLDRVINYTPAGYTNHGVHINGIVGGAGLIDPKGEGMATKAMLSDHYFSDVLVATPDIYEKHNVTVTNNSYSATRGSCEYAGTYDELSKGLDELSLAYPEVLQVFAAANDGLFDCPPYPTGFATIAGGYQTAKNALIVTSTDKEYQNASNASRGPIRDGRLKPEISAVGVDVNSTTKNEEYLVASGTSMACPQVAAAAGLLNQRYMQINNGTNPPSNLIKTLLINGSTDIGNIGPDFKYGFGFLNMRRSLIMLDSNRFVQDNITSGVKKDITINVPVGTGRLKVMLYWHDIAASPLSAKQLINDLDITVTEPNNTVYNPLVLDATPSNINNNAVEKVDRLNNCEQVVINNPVQGQYTITVNGFNVNNSQDYVVAYDFIPEGIYIKYPLEGIVVKAKDSTYIYWESLNNSNTFKIELTTDNGSSWSTLVNNLPGNARHYKFIVPDSINSGRCRVKISRNNSLEESTSGRFTINEQSIILLNANQCPGYMQIDWTAVPNATAYEVLKKDGPEFKIIDTTSITNYTISGLDHNDYCYATIRPIIDGSRGYRSIAIKRLPSDGDCNGSISDNDLMMEAVVAPQSGRALTSSSLSNNEPIIVQIRNLDDQVCDSYKVVYTVNNGAPSEVTFIDGIDAKGAKQITLANYDFSSFDSYIIEASVINLAAVDPVSVNNTLVKGIRQLPNDPVIIDFTDDFEAMPSYELRYDSLGLGSQMRWDYANATDTGRVRSYVLNSITIDGSRSVSMDMYKNSSGNINEFTGTFNLSKYDANNDEIRLEFDYKVHGIPRSLSNNEVVVRGNDMKVFQKAYTYNTILKNIGEVQSSTSISLSDVMLNTGDNFSTSTQVQFKQSDTSVIASSVFGNGLTIDNVRLYSVQNDIQIVQVVSPELFGCGITGPVPLTIEIKNGVNKVLNNIQLNYKLDNNTIVTENLSLINSKESLQYTFTKSLDISEFGSHVLNIWVSVDGDTYKDNDSINNYVIRNQPLITEYPYKEDFEQGNGFWYSDGINNSWMFGTPSANKISAAASGKNAWVTNLKGNYNDNEVSYLYSPCFDISQLDKPKLSFNLALDIENCGQVFCDGANMEYTIDGENWQILGTHKDGINWYTDSNYYAWNIEDKTSWHQASIFLPDSIEQLQLRYVLRTDPGSTREGIGVDDIRIYNERLVEGNNEVLTLSPNPTTNGNICIEWGANAGTKMRVMMSDVSGKVVYHSDHDATQGYNKTCIQTPAFSSGVYFMNIYIGDKQHIRKVVYTRR